MLCDQALNKLVSDPQASVAPYELASFLRLSSDCAEQVTAHAVEAEHEDQNTGPDPIVLEFRAHVEKACEDKLKRDALSQPPPPPAPVPATNHAPPPPPAEAPSPRGERVG